MKSEEGEEDEARGNVVRLYMLSRMLQDCMVFSVSLCVIYLVVLLYLVVVFMLRTPKIQ